MTDSGPAPRARRAAPARSAQAEPIRPVILGILNVTPDSFSDGGTHDDTASAVEFASELMAGGADIVDVGGESTRPGAERLPAEEEQRRVTPVIRELVARGIPVSIDTMNAGTAAIAAELGASIINDVSAGAADPDMPRVVAESGLMFVAMHSRGPSATMNERAVYLDAVTEVRIELEYRIAALITEGVRPERIIVDPGIGFSKNPDDDWQLLGSLRELRVLGHPLLVGASRKRFLADLLPADAKVRGRDPATSVISALAAQAGVWGVRVHDVRSTAAALDVWTRMSGARR